MKKVSVFALSMGAGGAERVISVLLPRLSEDYNVTLFVMFNVFHYPLPPRLKVICVSKKAKLTGIQKIALIPKTLLDYYLFVKKEKIDISVSFLTVPNLINSIVKIFNKRLHVVISERNFPSIEYRSSYFRYRVYKTLIPLLYSKADVLFSNSIWINEDLAENFNVRTRMEVLYNPTILPAETKQFNDYSQKEMIKFITVGRVIATKNQKMIIDALSNINNKNYSLAILGDGLLKDHLYEYVDEKGLTTIKFEGNVSDVHDYLIKSDCFILSSNSEGFPNALLEAMASGLPVISTNCKSGPLELLNENVAVKIIAGDFVEAKYGILVNVNDSLGLISAVNHLMNNRNLFAIYSAKSLQRASDFEVNKVYKKFKKILSNSSPLHHP